MYVRSNLLENNKLPKPLKPDSEDKRVKEMNHLKYINEL